MKKNLFKKISLILTVTILMNILTIFQVSAETIENQNPDSKLKSNEYEKKVKDEYIVKYKTGVNENEKKEDRIETDSELIEKTDSGVELLKTDEENVDIAIETLEDDKNIEYVCPNYIRESTATPNDELLSEQWAIENTNASSAWDILDNEENLSTVKVAVIDTGMDMEHEDLVDRISDDGYDFVDMDTNPTYGEYDEEHATHVAGIIAATCNNEKGIAGMSGNTPVEIMPIRVLEYGYGDDYTISEGIKYAADNDADIINLSLGGIGNSEFLNEAVNYAMEKGVIVIAAAGNSAMNSKLFSPSCIPGVVSVSATDSEDNYTYFTNYGNEVDISAPGLDIMSSIPEDMYEMYSGTSMSTPAVCAGAAMIKSIHPEYSSVQIEEILYSSSKDLGSDGRDRYFGYGLIDYEKALKTDPSDSLIKIQDIANNKRVFYSTDVNIKYYGSSKLSKVDFYLDNKLLNTETENLDKILISSNLDINEFENGTKTLNVIATDEDGNTFEDSINLNVVNEVTDGVRVQVVDGGIPIPYSTVEIMGEITYEENGESETYMGSLYYDFTDENGYIDVGNEDLYGVEDYIIFSENYEYLDKNEDEEIDGIIINDNIKEISNSGLVIMDNQDLITPNYINNIEGAESEILIDGQYKLKNGNFLDYPSFLLTYIFDDDYTIDLNIPEGTYNASLNSISNIDNEEKFYNLKEEFTLTKESLDFTFNLDNTVEVTEIFEDIKEVDNEIVNFGFFEEDGSGWAMSTENTSDRATFIMTPQKSTPIVWFDIEQNGYFNSGISKGNEVDYKAEKSYTHYFGGSYKSKVNLDKKSYKKEDNITITPTIMDKYNNTLDEVFTWTLFGEEASDGLSIKKINKTHDGFQINSWNDKTKVFDTLEVEENELLNYKIKNCKGEVVKEESLSYIYEYTTTLPEDINKGKYKFELTTKFPYDLFSSTKFKVK
jgi:hypothetical protein